MSLCRHRVSCLAMLIAAIIWVGCSSKPAPPPTIGSTAPDFTLTDKDGQSKTLSSYRGKWVVLYFYPSAMSDAGIDEARDLQRDFDKYVLANIVLVGITGSSAASQKRLANDEKLQATLLSDPDLTVAKMYGSTMRDHMVKQYAARNTFVIDPDGKVAATFIPAKTKQSPQLLAAIAELQRKSTSAAPPPQTPAAATTQP